MCFSAPVSLVTYLIGMSGSLAMHASGDTTLRLLSYFYATVVQMQLVDLALWLDRRASPAPWSGQCSGLNTTATRAGILINHLEPLVLYAAVLALGNPLPPAVHALVAAYTLYTVDYTRRALKTVTCTTVTPESAPHLHWRWNDMTGKTVHYTLFLSVLVALSLWGLPSHSTMHATVLLVSFGISMAVYQKRKSTGAMWCFLAAFVPWLLVEK